MFADLLRLSRQTLTYGLGHVVTRLVGFVLLPVFTHHLSPEDYAVYALFYLAVSVAMELVRLGLDVALLRFYVPEKDPVRRREVFSTVGWAALAFTTAVAGLLWSFPHTFLKLVVTTAVEHPPGMVYTLRLCAAILWLDNLSAFPLVVMRGENQPVRFTFIKLSGTVVQVAATVVLLVHLDRGVPGIFEANLVSSLWVMGWCAPTIAARAAPVFRPAVLSACLWFGLPNLPNALFVQVIELADRKILELLRSTTEVGVYAAGYRLGMFLSIVAMGFRFAWQPFFLQNAERPESRPMFARVLTYYLAIVSYLYLLLTAFVPPLARLDLPLTGPLIHPDYWEGLRIFPLILLAHVFNGVWAVFMVGIYLEKKMHVLPVFTGISAAVNVLGNLWLVPRFGMWASAWLTVVSYALVAALLFLYVRTVYPVPYEWRRVFHAAGTAAACYLVGAWGRRRGMPAFGYAASLIFPAALAATGFLNAGELARLRTLLSVRRG